MPYSLPLTFPEEHEESSHYVNFEVPGIYTDKRVIC